METQLMDEFDSSFLYEWKTAEEDLEFLDYTHCYEVDNPNKRSASKAAATTTISLTEYGKNTDIKQTVLNISVEKLRRIDDPESCLRRTVLISNTMKRLRSRKDSEGKILKDKESSEGSCFTYSLPCKRARLHVTDLLNSNTTAADKLKCDYEALEYQKSIHTKRKDTTAKELWNKKTIAGTGKHTTTCHLPLTTGDESKRNCETVRFNGLDLQNVICALET